MESFYLNAVQNAAFELIQSDARFLHTLIDINRNAERTSSNFIMMSQPYIGVFVDGAEQWCKKVGLESPTFRGGEKEYYRKLRKGHKLFEKSYAEYSELLMKTLADSDRYFYSNRGLLEKIFGYNNVGIDLCNGEYCGNTSLGAVCAPMQIWWNQDAGKTMQSASVIAGELAGFFDCKAFLPYKYDDKRNIVKFKDYHFFQDCPLKEKTEYGFVLFSILCSINYVTAFIESYFIEEIPQKFKFAYLQYYYLCSFIDELNRIKGSNLIIDYSLQNREFRNCLAHYGLGQYLVEEDVLSTDILKGLTNKALNLEYFEAKQKLFEYLNSLRDQIKSIILA